MKAPVVLHSYNEWEGSNGPSDKNRIAFYTFMKCEFTYRFRVMIRLDPSHRFANSLAVISNWEFKNGWNEVIFLPGFALAHESNINKIEEDLVDRAYSLLYGK